MYTIFWKLISNSGVDYYRMKSTAIRLAPDKDHRRMTRDTQRQQVFIREYRSDGSGFSIEPYVRG